MAVEKIIDSRIVHKHDIEANWLKATGFYPKQGEIIVYDIDDTHDYERFKIGDGKTLVSDLPFTYDTITIDEIDAICNQTITTEGGSGNTEVKFIDASNNNVYNLYVEDGKLCMAEGE